MKKPNIVLITIDCLRYDYFIQQLKTQADRIPFIKKLSKNALIFDNFYANGAWSGTTMPSVLTSTYPFDNQGVCTIVGREPSVSQVLKKAGYFNFGVHANPHFLSIYGYDIDFDYFYDWFSSSNDQIYQIKPNFWDFLKKAVIGNNIFIKYLLSIYTKTVRPIFEMIYPNIKLPYPSAKEINSIVFRCLEYYRDDFTKKPFFLWLHFMDLHEPIFPEKKYIKEGFNIREIKRLYTKISKRQKLDLTKKENKILKELYLAALSQVDDQIKHLYEFIKNNLDLENTVFIITADHGQLLADKENYYGHGVWLFEEIVHIPLIIAGEKIKASQTRDVSSQIDLAPTIANIAGAPSPLEWEGKPMVDKTLKISRQGKRVVFIEEGMIKKGDNIKHSDEGIQFVIRWKDRSFAVVSNKYKYIRNFYSEKEELYDLNKDRDEKENLIHLDEFKKERELMRNNLIRHLKRYENYID